MSALLLIHSDALHFFQNIIVRKLSCNLFCPVNDHIRNTCQFGYLDTVASVSTTLYDLAQEYNVISFFLNSDTIVGDIIHLALQLCQLMIMGGKQCFGSKKLFIADMFDHCPCNG